MVGSSHWLEELSRAVDQRGVRAVLLRALRAASARGCVVHYDASSIPALESIGVRPGSGRSWLPPGIDSGTRAHLPRHHLQQGRLRSAYAATLRRRRGLFQRAPPVLWRAEIPEGG